MARPSVARIRTSAPEGRDIVSRLRGPPSSELRTSADGRVWLTSPERTPVSVMDTGAGLTPEKLTQLFQPLNRLGQESSAEEGTGIGLVMSKRLVEQMAGLVGVESAVGAGSTFWFELSSSTAPGLAVDPIEPALLTFDAGRGTLAHVLASPVASRELADTEEYQAVRHTAGR